MAALENDEPRGEGDSEGDHSEDKIPPELQAWIDSIVEHNQQEWIEKRARNLALKQEFDPARDLNDEQIEALLIYGEFLNIYRQLPTMVQPEVKDQAVTQELEVKRVLGPEVQIKSVRTIIRKNSTGKAESIGEGSKLVYGPIAEDWTYHVKPTYQIQGRFGYSFALIHNNHKYNLLIFIRGGEPLSEDTFATLEDSHLSPTSIIDFTGDRPFNPTVDLRNHFPPI